MPGIYEAEKKSLIDILTPDEVELRDKIALEAMKKIMEYPLIVSALNRGETHDAATHAIANSAYAMAGQMIRARKEVA